MLNYETLDAIADAYIPLLALFAFGMVVSGLWAAQWHKLSGYAILALLLFRLTWGFIGGTHARFGSFLRGPRVAIDYLGELTGRRQAQLWLGHNPLGGWSAIALLLSLAFQTISGLFISDEDLGLEGPLAK